MKTIKDVPSNRLNLKFIEFHLDVKDNEGNDALWMKDYISKIQHTYIFAIGDNYFDSWEVLTNKEYINAV